MYILEKPCAGDGPAIDNLLDICFGRNRHLKTSYRFRDGIADLPALRRVARCDMRLVGTIAYWPVRIGMQEGLLLGPVAVCPRLRGRQIGQSLIWQTLIQAQQSGHKRVILVGDYDYYHQFGFQPAREFGVRMAGEADRLLALPLAPGAFAGGTGTVTPAVP